MNTMNNARISVSVVLLGTAFFLNTCKLGGPDDGGNDPGVSSASDLRLTTEISGWSDNAGQYKEYDCDGLFDLIDGGAVAHRDNGLIEGIYQEMSGLNGRAVKIFVEDFGTAANATSMFEYAEQSYVTQPVTITSYPATVATASQTLSGISVYAHFGKFYFSLDFQGYTDQTTPVSDANGFLATYENKLQ
jgi:hypothetical protein